LEEFDEGVLAFGKEIKKNENEFWVTYAGSLATSYDIRTLIYAAKNLESVSDIQIKILGTGALKEGFENLADELHCKNVEFLGYLPYPKMAAYLNQSDVLINSFVKGAPQSIVNKIGDYLAAAKPMINTLENEEFQELVEERQFGKNIAPEAIDELSEAVLDYYQHPDMARDHGRHARRTAEELFDRKKTYQKILEIIEAVCKNESV
jgi:glycosyltransferase involved in cell wall biosynthesis